jgi:site-specific recombinase XerC
MNLQTAAEKFYAYQQLIRGFSPATIRRYKYVLTSLIKQTGNIPVVDIFVSSQHNQAFTDDGLKHLVQKVRQFTGLKFSVHKLRHSFATLMLEGGCDIYSLSKMMRHSQIGTTTIYLSASIEHLRKEIYKHPLKWQPRKCTAANNIPYLSLCI